jgi:hypothetical protein
METSRHLVGYQMQSVRKSNRKTCLLFFFFFFFSLSHASFGDAAGKKLRSAPWTKIAAARRRRQTRDSLDIVGVERERESLMGEGQTAHFGPELGPLGPISRRLHSS